MSRWNILAAASVAGLAAATTGPCDIYAAGKTPCVAAHSTTRALYANYQGPLYTVLRNSDGTSINIKPLSAGGVANAAAQDTFCAKSTCLITVIFDQSGNHNDLASAPPGSASYGNGPNGHEWVSAANGAPVTLNGRKAYGVFSTPGTGYRNNTAVGTATGDKPQGMYAVLDGTHFNDGCCFDYGNAEVNNKNNGNGHMEAIYFGSNSHWGSGAGSGPWIMADLENGLYAQANTDKNTNNPSQTSRFVSAFVKGKPNKWAIKGGNANSGKLTTYYKGARPSGYNPMSKEGAIVLGIGGDNSDDGQGTFYEGVMTSGYPSKKTETKVQQNIVAAKYAAASLVSGPAVKVGSTITMRATTKGFNTRYISHNGSDIVTEVITSSSPTSVKQRGQWKVITGLGNRGCVTFESVDMPGRYIRHYKFVLYLAANDGSAQFAEDATFCPQKPLKGRGNALRAWNYPTRLFRHYGNTLYVAAQGGNQFFDTTSFYAPDTSFVISTTFIAGS